MNKLSIFTNHFYPETFRINELAKRFSENNEVNIITQVPNYPNGDFFAGYSNRKKRSETYENIKVKRLWTIPRKQNSIMLMINYITYTISAYLYGNFSRDKTDHVYVYVTSPIFLSYGALRFAKRNNVKTTMYLLDLWPETLFSILNIKNKFLIKRFDKMMNKLYKRFDNIIVGSKSFEEALIRRGISADKIYHLPQHADEILDNPIKINKNDEKLKIIFTGNIGSAQGLETLVESIEILNASDIENVHITLVGDGRNKDNLKNMIKEKNLDKYFTFVNRVAQSEVQAYLKKNHLGFVSLKDINPLNKTLPAKVQSYMAYGLPILSCGSQETSNLIQKVNCGLYCNSSAISLAETIKEALKLKEEELVLMGYNGNKYSKENFDINNIISKMETIMKEGK